MSSSPQPEAGTASGLGLQSDDGSTMHYETNNQAPRAGDHEESFAPPDVDLERGAEFPIYLDTENRLPRPADDEQSSAPPHVLQELPVPPPPYERGAEHADGRRGMEIIEQLQRYQNIASVLREALAGRSSIFTEAEIDLACRYMCSTTRDNLASACFETIEQGAHVFAQYSRALDFFQTAVQGAHIDWQRMFLENDVRPHMTAAAVIDFLLVTHILIPRMQELVDFVESFASP